jgi:hypothetical protein
MKKLTPIRKILKKDDLAHGRHVDFLETIEEMSMKAFDHVMDRMVRAIIARLKQPATATLKKADDLKRGWTGAIPKADLDIGSTIDELMEQYTSALRWILLGDAAGRDARVSAKLMGLEEFVVPGIVPAAYMDSLDTHRQHYEDIFGTEPAPINKGLIGASLKQISTRTGRFMDEAEIKMQNRLVEVVEVAIRAAHEATIASIHQTAHDLMGEGAKPKAALDEAIEQDAPGKIPVAGISRALKEAIERYRPEWQLMTRTDTNLASAVGTHQSLVETFGRQDDTLRIAWFAFRDEKTCNFCSVAARRLDGSFKIYQISDFQPAGFNLSLKKKDWVLSIPPAHYNCRCQLIYIPPGFDIDDNGNIRPKAA